MIELGYALSSEEHPREVKEARLETEGQTSVVKADSSKPVKRKDLRLLR